MNARFRVRCMPHSTAAMQRALALIAIRRSTPDSIDAHAIGIASLASCGHHHASCSSSLSCWKREFKWVASALHIGAPLGALHVALSLVSAAFGIATTIVLVGTVFVHVLIRISGPSIIANTLALAFTGTHRRFRGVNRLLDHLGHLRWASPSMFIHTRLVSTEVQTTLP